MVRKHVGFAASVAAPWVAVGGAVSMAYGLLWCQEPGQITSGASALAAAPSASTIPKAARSALIVPSRAPASPGPEPTTRARPG